MSRARELADGLLAIRMAVITHARPAIEQAIDYLQDRARCEEILSKEALSAMDIDELRAWAEWALTDKHEKADGRSATLARIAIAVLDERERDKARIDAALRLLSTGAYESRDWIRERVKAALTKP